jgi:hypothetical protein
MYLTYDLVADRDPMILMRDGMQSGAAQSFARVIDRKDCQPTDRRFDLALTLMAAALEVDVREINLIRNSGLPCDLDLKKALGGAVSTIYQLLQDLPAKLWDALLAELGKGNDTRALLIVQIHNNAVNNIINHGGPTRADDFLYDAALLAAGA